MLAVSARFLSGLRYSNYRKTVADIYFDNGLLFGDVPIKSGSLTIDRNAEIRRSGSISLASDDINLSLFQPNGLEINLRSGLVYANGDTELVSLGWYRTETFTRQDGVSKEVGIDLYDRAKVHQDIQTFWDIDRSGLTVVQAKDVYTSYSFAGLGYTPTTIWDTSFNQGRKLPGGSIAGGTHLDAMNMIALTLAGEFYFDPDGNQVFGVIPKVDPDFDQNVSVWDIDVGATGVLVEANISNTRANTYNGVSVLGATADSGTRAFAVALDSNPASPTWFSGTFGRKTLRIESDTLTTNAACFASATSQLANLTGLSKNVSFTALWNPALQEGDVCLFKFLDGTQEFHLIDSLNFDFASGEMTGETRTAQYVA